jgi:hypothetical protein
MQFRIRASILAIVTVIAAALVAGCEEPSPCETICVRVAECRRQVPEDERMLGEKDPSRDKLCKQRCQDNPEGFAACEGKKKLCPDLLSCTGRF